jgi:hypothetical protein
MDSKISVYISEAKIGPVGTGFIWPRVATNEGAFEGGNEIVESKKMRVIS